MRRCRDRIRITVEVRLTRYALSIRTLCPLTPLIRAQASGPSYTRSMRFTVSLVGVVRMGIQSLRAIYAFANAKVVSSADCRTRYLWNSGQPRKDRPVRARTAQRVRLVWDSPGEMKPRLEQRSELREILWQIQ